MENLELDRGSCCLGQLIIAQPREPNVPPGWEEFQVQSSLCIFQRLLTSIWFSRVLLALEKEGIPWSIMVCVEAVFLTAKHVMGFWIYREM